MPLRYSCLQKCEGFFTFVRVPTGAKAKECTLKNTPIEKGSISVNRTTGLPDDFLH